MSSAGMSITNLKDLVRKDIDESNELQTRIDALAKSIAEGKDFPKLAFHMMEQSNAATCKDLIRRMEKIEDQPGKLTPTDKEMLQALTARLAIWDKHASRLIEFRDLEIRAHGIPETIVPDSELPRNARARSLAKKLEESEERPQPLLEKIDEDIVAMPSPSAFAAPSSLPTPGGPLHHEDVGSSRVVDGREIETVEHASCPDEDYDVSDFSDEGAWSEPDRSSWPLLYQIVDVNPRGNATLFNEELAHSMKTLAAKHDPRLWPNDHDAAARWTAINKAHDVLTDPSRRLYYDIHGKVPEELQDFDLSTLSLGD